LDSRVVSARPERIVLVPRLEEFAQVLRGARRNAVGGSPRARVVVRLGAGVQPLERVSEYLLLLLRVEVRLKLLRVLIVRDPDPGRGAAKLGGKLGIRNGSTCGAESVCSSATARHHPRRRRRKRPTVTPPKLVCEPGRHFQANLRLGRRRELDNLPARKPPSDFVVGLSRFNHIEIVGKLVARLQGSHDSPFSASNNPACVSSTSR
jgi:hypothetical protein